MPRYLDDSYSVGNSILSNLSRNYLVSAFAGSLSEIVGNDLLVVGEGKERFRLFRKESEMQLNGIGME